MCVWLVNKIQAKRMHRLDAVFAKRLLTTLKSLTLDQRSRPQWLNIHFFLHNSLLTSLLYISTFLSLIKLKSGLSLRYALFRFVVEFHKNQMGDDVTRRHLRFLHTNVHISNSNEPTHFNVGTNIQQQKYTPNNESASYLDKSWWSQVKVKGQRSHKINKWF